MSNHSCIYQKIHFLECSLMMRFFEANDFNQDLIIMKIRTASEKIVRKC